jgi:hypothetical protein
VFPSILTQHPAEPSAAGRRNLRIARSEPADGTAGRHGRRARPDGQAICLRTTARTGTALPTGTIEQAACWSRGPQRGRHNGLPSLRHRQQHGPGVSAQLERHETPDPVRSNAVNAGFQCVREAPGSGPIFMINISRAAFELVRYERGIHAVWTATRG